MAFEFVIQRATLLDGRSVDIGIDAGKIVALGKSGTLSAAKLIDAEGGLCTRPLTDAHLHLDKAGTARLTGSPPTTISEAIRQMVEIKRKTVTQPKVLQDRMIATLHAVRGAGTRCLRALVDVDETWGLMAFEAAKAARDSVAGDLEVRIVAFPQDGMTPKVADMLRQASEDGADAIGAHTDIDEDFKGHLKTAASIARAANLPLEVHVDEAASPRSFRLPAVLEASEQVSSLTLVHCLSLGTLDEQEQDRWIERVHQARANVVIAPAILGFGLPLAPVAKLVAAGVPVLVGSDNLRDVFMPLGTARVLELLRTVCLVQGLKTPETVSTLFRTALGGGFSLITGATADLIEGSPASITIFEGKDAMAVITGEDTIRADLKNGIA